MPNNGGSRPEAGGAVGSSVANAVGLAPAVLRGAPESALMILQDALRARLEQPRLLLGSDSFQSFHRITLVPKGPPLAIERPREPYPQIELLTDGERCWLREVGGEAWRVEGVECVRSPAPG